MGARTQDREWTRICVSALPERGSRQRAISPFLNRWLAVW